MASQAVNTFGSLASQIQNANGSAAGLTAAFAEQLGQSAQVQNLLEKAKQQFPEASRLVSQAASALPSYYVHRLRAEGRMHSVSGRAIPVWRSA